MPGHSVPLIDRARHYRDRIAVIDDDGSLAYDELLDTAGRLASRLLPQSGDLAEARVAFRLAPGRDWVVTQWAIWMAGGVAVPLALSHPAAELRHVLEDCGASLLLADAAGLGLLASVLEELKVSGLDIAGLTGEPPPRLPRVEGARRAMILYTSGTTGKPKGVVTTHDNICAEIQSLVEAWAWTPDDHILSVLPLHHTHGIVNVVASALWSGAICEMLPEFNAAETWARIQSSPLTLFMAVPTIYQRLIKEWDSRDIDDQRSMSQAGQKLRLMVSGSSALPESTLQRWHSITGQTLLERYGMTETGMILGNPLQGERRQGTVGVPFPEISVRLVNDDGQMLMTDREANAGPGHVQVMGPGVFGEYWNRPEETVEAFSDGWFKTGDVAVLEDGYFRLLGRTSVDIIKTGGFKVSALEIEEALRHHPAIIECAVVGLPDKDWGECVCAAVVTASEQLDRESLRDWARDYLAPYKLPRRVLCLDDFPRNAMGKVVKPELRELFLATD